MAVDKSPLYRRRLGARAASMPPAELPPVGKAALMRGFDDWATDRDIHLDEIHRFIADPGNSLRRCGHWAALLIAA